MQIYLVGGAVRDRLLNLPVEEKDWVVVGATPEQMLTLGYKQVGKDFPVFLHPKTKEEYALARIERKIGKGYTGFVCDASAKVTLEDDLKRRDLTINAIAEDKEGQIKDPFGGKKDIELKLLRHVSDAFAEDPVRILRAARFLARFYHLGFRVAPETISLMASMVEAGEVEMLVPERVWRELERALKEKNPEEFFKLLEICGASPILFPIALNLKGLVEVVKKTDDAVVRFAVLLSDANLSSIKRFNERYPIPNEYRELLMLAHQMLPIYTQVETLSAENVVRYLQKADAFRRFERFEKCLLACQFATQNLFTKNWLSYALAAKAVRPDVSIQSGKEIAEQLFLARVKVIDELRAA